mmetsp:Transcript_66597/g.124282  ORF Transcript_66597/g.124282 Transcript_66597/m.124282 type:complete len:346 (-) Transcript_66597:105-1142(-)
MAEVHALALLLAACIVCCSGLQRAYGPVVAILAMPEFKPAPNQAKRSYISASYVKWLEAHGAHVVPLLHDAPRSEVRTMLGQVNGVVFPGGAFPMEPGYEAFSRYVFSYAMENKVPLWGECLGLLQFLLYTSGEESPGPVTDGWNATGPFIVPLHLTDAGRHRGPAATLSRELREGLEHKPWAWHSHAFSIGMSAFNASKRMQSFWDVLAVDRDRTGSEFISMVSGKAFPFTATMFHPEKNSFEFMPERTGKGQVPETTRSSAAIDAMSHLGDYFLDQCRAFRGQRMTHKELMVWSIHNWDPQHTAPKDSVFESIFYFPARDAVPLPALTGSGQPLAHWGGALSD